MTLCRNLAATAAVFAALAVAGGARAQQAESKIGAWRYGPSGSGFAARAQAAAHDKAYLVFRCERPGPVSIVAALAPGEKLGSFADGQVRRPVGLKIDASTNVDKDWFYPDESKGETELTRTGGVDSVDMLKIVRRGECIAHLSKDMNRLTWANGPFLVQLLGE